MPRSLLSQVTAAPGEAGVLLGIHRADLQCILRASLPHDGHDDVRVDALMG